MEIGSDHRPSHRQPLLGRAPPLKIHHFSSKNIPHCEFVTIVFVRAPVSEHNLYGPATWLGHALRTTSPFSLLRSLAHLFPGVFSLSHRVVVLPPLTSRLASCLILPSPTAPVRLPGLAFSAVFLRRAPSRSSPSSNLWFTIIKMNQLNVCSLVCPRDDCSPCPRLIQTKYRSDDIRIPRTHDLHPRLARWSRLIPISSGPAFCHTPLPWYSPVVYSKKETRHGSRNLKPEF